MAENLFSVTTDSVRLLDVVERTSSPYDTKTIFVFAPLKTAVRQFNAVSFSLPAAFWLMPGITSVQIDFGDGKGFRTLSQNSTVSINYPDSGSYVATAKINTVNGMFTAKSKIEYDRPKTYYQADSTWVITVPPVLRVVNNKSSRNGQVAGILGSRPCGDGSLSDEVNCDIYPGAVISVNLGCDHVFDKPIIIVDGFDPTHEFDGAAIAANFDRFSFESRMKSLGYDFVIVVFTKTTDPIENNAKVLEAVINKVNATKSGSNRSTVIGWSMGGLVARWCLKDMEDRILDHQVANYFSYDAPHQGANVQEAVHILTHYQVQ